MLNYFANIVTLIKGLAIGFIFGYLLQRAKVSRFNVIINQFLLKDFTMLKVMGAAIASGTIALYSAKSFGLIKNIPMPHSSLIAVLIGGLFLGVGLAISGYCPGTTFAAIGQGSKDAIFAAIGLCVGAGIYAEMHNWFQYSIFKGHTANTSKLSELIGISNWKFIAILLISLFVITLFTKKINKKN